MRPRLERNHVELNTANVAHPDLSLKQTPVDVRQIAALAAALNRLVLRLDREAERKEQLRYQRRTSRRREVPEVAA
jgi:hypothetical protein